MSDEDEITNDDMRLLYTGAANVLEAYALSTHFDFHRHSKILRQIVDGIEKLIVVIEANDGLDERVESNPTNGRAPGSHSPLSEE